MQPNDYNLTDDQVAYMFDRLVDTHKELKWTLRTRVRKFFLPVILWVNQQKPRRDPGLTEQFEEIVRPLRDRGNRHRLQTTFMPLVAHFSARAEVE